MNKQTRVIKQAKASPITARDHAEKIWLAGLGAMSIIQKQGLRIADRMIHEGRAYQARGKELASQLGVKAASLVEARVQPLKDRVQNVRGQVEARFEQGVGRVLSTLGIPSKADVDALIARVDKLSRQLKAAK